MKRALSSRPAVADEELRSRRRWVHLRAAMFLAACLVGALYMAPVPTDWDAWDYSAQAIRGHSSDLLLGRWWFIAVMRAAYLVVAGMGGTRGDVFTAMQTANGLMFGGGVVLLMAWTYRLSGRRVAELIAALLVLTGPMMGIYAMSIMTEPMTLLLLAGAFYCWRRGVQDASGAALHWAAGAGACLGVVADIREPAALLCLWPVVSVLVEKPARRWSKLLLAAGAGAVTLAIGVLMAWQWYPVEYTGRTYWENMSAWTEAMSRERSAFGPGLLVQLRLLGEYAVAASPVAALGLIPAAIWAGRRRHVTFWLLVGTLGYVGTLVLNHNLAVNPRFSLPWIWVLIPLVAWALSRLIDLAGERRNLAGGVVLAGLVLAGVGAHAATFYTMREAYFGYVRSMTRQYRVMRALPADAMVIAGPGTPIAQHLIRTGDKDFLVVGSGWGWPEDAVELRSRVDTALAEGRDVFVNMDASDWQRVRRDSGEWEMVRDVSRRYHQIKRDEIWPLVQWTLRRAGPVR
jgi:hypothetical protein